MWRLGFLSLWFAVSLALGCAAGQATHSPDGSAPPDAGAGDAVGQDDAEVPDGASVEAAAADAAPGDAASADRPSLDASGDAAVPQDAAPQPDVAPQQDAAPAPDAGGCVVQNLLVNGGFDLGPTSEWNAYSDLGLTTDPVIYASALLAHGSQAGAYAVRLGNTNDVQNYVYQTVTVPPRTTALRLTGYRWIDTAESGGIYDGAWLELHRSSDLSLLEELAFYSDEDATSGWVAFSLPAAAPHAGETIDLLVDSLNDSSYVTTFFFDTLALEATVCP